MMHLSKEMMGATSIPLILTVLEEGESYGYQIIQRIRELSDGSLEWKEGTLYPILHKLEKKGLIRSVWKNEGGRKRKYYQLLEPGKTVLLEEKQNWLSLNEILIRLWQPKTNLI